MAITVLPRTKSGGEEFTEAFSPYLQMAMEMMLKKKMEEQQRQKSLEQLEKVQKQGAQVSGFTYDNRGNLVPQLKIPRFKERLEDIEAQELLGQAGYGGVSAPPPMPQPGQLQPTTPTIPSSVMPTSMGGLLGAKLQAKEQEQISEAKIKSKGEVLKLSDKAKANFGRTVSMFKNIVAQQKGAAEEQGGLGLGPGLRGQIMSGLRQPGYGRAAAFGGQRTETALSLNNILTGQNRAIRSVIEMILGTLPTPLDPEDQVAGKLAQSIKNSYMLIKSFEKSGIDFKKMSQDELDSLDANSLIRGFTLTPDEEMEVENIIRNVLSTPAAPARTLSGTVPNQYKSFGQKTNKIGRFTVEVE